jgi:hypothetical protein
VADPFQELDIATRDRVVTALYAWAERQEDPSEPVLRFLDGSALSPQDLLDESPAHIFLPPDVIAKAFPPDTGEPPSRAWSHVVNLVAVSVQHGENLDEILSELANEYEAL